MRYFIILLSVFLSGCETVQVAIPTIINPHIVDLGSCAKPSAQSTSFYSINGKARDGDQITVGMSNSGIQKLANNIANLSAAYKKCQAEVEQYRKLTHNVK